MLKRCNKYININNMEFNLKGVVNSEHINNLKFDKLENCYARPSQAKINIYNNWYNTLANDSSILYYGVGSYNCNIFTINSVIELNNKKYYLHITPTKNECYEVID